MKRSNRTLTAAALTVLALQTAASGVRAHAQTTTASQAPSPSTTAKPKQAPPPPQPAKDVQFPSFEQKTLPNGLRVVVVEHHETPAVTVQMLIKAGQAFEPAAKAGLSGATANLLREGTATRSAQQIAGAIDSIGGNLNAFAGRDSAYVTLQVTSDQLDLGLGLLTDVVLRPSFPAEELERWRRQSLNGLQVQQKNAAYLASATFQRAVFGEHPYGLPFEGTPESLSGLGRDDLSAFHREHYVPNETILAVVGDVKPAEAFAKIERAFGAWQKGKNHEVPKVEAARVNKHRIVVVDVPDAVQTEIRVGQVGLAFRDPDFFVSEVYNSVLGGGSTARLYQEIRQKRGLSYGASSSFSKALQPGWFRASTFTKTESTVEALQVLLEAMQALEDTPVPAAELEARKTYLSGVFPLEIETPEGIASKVVEALMYGYGREYIESYRGRIDAVTAEQVQSFAQRRIHPESTLIVVAGNASAFLPDLQKKIGPAEVIPYQELDLLRADLRKPKQEAPAKPAN
jgi:zinc protease